MSLLLATPKAWALNSKSVSSLALSCSNTFLSLLAVFNLHVLWVCFSLMDSSLSYALLSALGSLLKLHGSLFSRTVNPMMHNPMHSLYLLVSVCHSVFCFVYLAHKPTLGHAVAAALAHVGKTEAWRGWEVLPWGSQPGTRILDVSLLRLALLNEHITLTDSLFPWWLLIPPVALCSCPRLSWLLVPCPF